MTRDDPAAFAPPPSFGPFRVLHQIGIGALGPVFRTYEPTRDRLIAVKVFRLDVTPEQAQTLADELSRAAEAGLFHPSIVEPIAAGVEGTVAYRAEEYVAAESLDAAMRHYAPASLEKALPFITQLAGAIDFARSAGVGHGALHLRDIFITPDEARASGFGVVEALERVGLRAPVRRPYSAPERIAGETWGTPADVFSLGAIAYELLTGRRPAGIGEQIGPLAGDNVGEFADSLRAVLARAMDDDPARRYQSALGFASALEAAGCGERITEAVRAVGVISRSVPLAAGRDIFDEPAETIDPGQEDDVEYDEKYNRPAAELEPEAAAELEPEAAAELEPEAAAELEPEAAAELELEAAAELEDIAAERDSDAAHYELSRAESDAPPRFEFAGDEDPEGNAEAAADLALDAPATPRCADDFSLPALVVGQLPGVVDDKEPETPGYYGTSGISDGADDGSPAERPRPAMLPIAVTLIVGLLIGFAAGYAVGGRDSAAPDGSSQVDVAPRAPAPRPARPPGPQRGESGKAYSDQTVARPETARPETARPETARPPVAPPGVPDEAPAPRPAAPGSAATGSIVVRSTPPRAAVTVNGRWRGRTPLTLARLPLGPYTVRIVRPGYATAREDFRLSAAEPSRTLSFRLTRGAAAAPPPPPPPSRVTPAPSRTRPSPSAPPTKFAGSLYVDSRPRGARVIIDGREAGTTPARIADVSIGSHVVRLELPDHRWWSNAIRIVAGQETRVTGSLERIR